MQGSNQDMTRYIIVGLARSGTTVVHFALKGHPDVSALNDEVKLNFFTEGISCYTQRDDNQKEKEVGYLRLFDSLSGVFQNENTLALGMKYVPHSVETTKEFVARLRQYFPQVKVVLINRKDLVAQYGSSLRAESTGEWHSWSTSGEKKNYSVRIRPYKFRAYALNCIAMYEILRSLTESHEVLHFNYEKCFLQDGKPDFTNLFNFIGVSNQEATWLGSEKVAGPPESFIKNYNELKKNLVEINEEYISPQ